MTDHLASASLWIEKAFEALDEGGVNASLGMLLIAVREHNKHLRSTAPAATVREERQNPCYWCARCSRCLDANEAVCRSCGSTARATEAKSYADPTGTFADKRGTFAEEKPAEADVSDEPDDEELDALYVSEARKHFNDHSCAQRALWRDGFAKGRSSAARELAERDERIRELEAKVSAWEPVVRNLNHEVGIAFDRAIDAYDAIPAHLRPGEKA